MAKKHYDDDDGRVSAPMNVDGMPWYSPESEKPEKMSNGENKLRLTRGDRTAFVGGILAASLLIAGVFGAVYFLVIFLLTRAA